MSDPLRPLKVNAVELLRQPGATRTIDVELSAAALDVGHPRLAGDVRVSVRLDALDDGIAVTGRVTAPATGVCRRCLAEQHLPVVAEVAERYQVEVTDEEAFPIEHGQLDLSPMVRELLLLELDAEVQCRDDCRGLCPVCGVDRNVESCDCDTEVRDERWAALADIELDD
jgi:uncharacterized protein